MKIAKDTSIIENIVSTILDIKSKNYEADVSIYENRIDEFFYHLYNLTYDEVLIVDPETPIVREEYES